MIVFVFQLVREAAEEECTRVCEQEAEERELAESNPFNHLLEQYHYDHKARAKLDAVALQCVHGELHREYGDDAERSE